MEDKYMKMTKTLTAAMVFGTLTLSAGLVNACTHHMLGGNAPCAGMDTDGDGAINEQEFNTIREQRLANIPTFADIDTDGDGLITAEELAAMHQERWKKSDPAHYGMGMRKGMRGMGHSCQEMDPEKKEKHDAYMAATADLRKEIAVKRAEKRAVMMGTDPDPEQAAQLTRELLELRSQMMVIAEESGVDFGPGNGCWNSHGKKGHGRGPGGGPRM